MKSDKYPLFLLIIFSIFWIILAIDPSYRYMWFIENLILLIFLSIIILTYKKFRFSNTSYTLLFIFCILQTIGAHYTYAEVPFSWFTEFFGFERNHYDRVVHFSFGLLIAYPFREFLLRTSKIKGAFWKYFIPIEMAFATGAFYEVVEMLFAVISDPNAGHAFLGSQGDVWDAQKDMGLAGLGAMITMLVTWIVEKSKDNNLFKK